MSEPGLIYIAPTREDAERDAEVFYSLLEAHRPSLSLKAIAGIVDDKTNNPDQNMHKRIKNKSFSTHEKRLILRHIYEHGVPASVLRSQIGGCPDALFHALLMFLGVNETSQDKARARLIGTYRFYRFSSAHDGEYVIGKLTITHDKKSRALCAEMLQLRLPGRNEPGIRERFTGYALRVANMYLVFMRHTRTSAVRMLLLGDFHHDDVGTDINPGSCFKGRVFHAVSMDGHELGVDGNKPFYSPVHMSLVEDVTELALLDQQLDVVPEDDPRLPARVVKKLQAKKRHTTA